MYKRHLPALWLLLIGAVPSAVLGSPSTKATVMATDRPNDGGGAIRLGWEPLDAHSAKVEIHRSEGEGQAVKVGEVRPNETKFIDKRSAGIPLEDGVVYRYELRALREDGSLVAARHSGPVRSEASWLHRGRIANLVVLLGLIGIFFLLFARGKRGKDYYIRPIAGLVAFHDAVGRAAEMGRSIIYAPGLGSVGDPATVASMALLSDVAMRAARMRTRVKVPNYSPLTWPVAQSVVRDAYARAGREESYDPHDIPYLTSRNMTYAAAVSGMMVRERSASNFLIGHFYSESLILAETGASTGAVQIGGTDSEVQLPFFITTCDYTLIGEELFAAGAVIDGNPTSRATIAAHDWFKVAAMVVIGFGFLLSLLGLFGVEEAASIGGKLSALLTEVR